jgi:thioredoxin reductase
LATPEIHECRNADTLVMFRRSPDGPVKISLPRVAVLGGGPVGLETALYAKSLGLPVTLFEAGQIGEFVYRWGFVRMFTPLGWNVTALGKQAVLKDKPTHAFPADTDLLSGREFRDAYIGPVSESTALAGVIRTKTAVLSIGRTGWRKTDPTTKDLPPFRLLVRDANGQERFEAADAVFDCTGTYARPNWAGDGGIPAAGEIAARPHAAYWLEDISGTKKNHYAGKCTAVIGGGFSAATAVCDLSTLALEHSATWIVWLTHGPRSQPLPRAANDPLKDRDRLAAKANSLAMRCDGNLEYHAQTQIDEITSHGPDKGFRIAARVNGKPTSWDVERLVAHVGYRPDVSLTQELRDGEPNYFVLGAKATGRDSGFLLRDARSQIREAFAMLLGKPGLNLYGKAA